MRDGTGGSFRHEFTIAGRSVGGVLGLAGEGGCGVSVGVDDSGALAEFDPPMTLADAQHAVASCRPQQKAPLAEWLAYHQRCAAWYAEVAEIDRGHHHEALFMAEQQRHLVREIKTQIPAPRPVGKE